MPQQRPAIGATPSSSMSKMSAQTLGTTGIDKLDSKLLHAVFQCLGCHQLVRCACVSVAWSKEAPLALTLALKQTRWQVFSDESVSKLEDCLGRHAGHLKGICVLQPESFLLPRAVSLPWTLLTQLQSISLHRIRIPKIPQPVIVNSSSTDVHHPLLPQLKQLELQECKLYSLSCLQLLASSSTLTSLQLPFRTTFETPPQQYIIPPPPRARLLLEQLQQRGVLQQLAVLHLPGMVAESLEVIPTMQRLQDLELCVTPRAMTARRPQTLTRLNLITQMGGLPRQLDSPLQLSSLQQLSLHYCSVSATVLEGVRQLRHLVLKSCHVHLGVFASVPQLLQLRPESGGPSQPEETEESSTLQQFRCLHSLNIIDCQLHDDLFYMRPAARPLLTAYTVSPQLTRLVLAHSSKLWELGTLQYMFPAGRQLPQLLELEIVSSVFDETISCVGSQDLSSIISSCVNLRKLVLCDVLSDGADLTPLLELPQCCRDLKVGGYAFTDSPIAGIVAQLTQLTALSIFVSWRLTYVGLDSLTALTHLDSLELYMCGVITQKDSPDSYHKLRLSGTDPQGPVHQQLHELCGKDKACLDARQQRLQVANNRA